MAAPVTVTDTTFKQEVLDSPVPVLVDFWAAWCSPCKMIAPIVEELSREYDGQLKVAKVDVDANPITPGMFGIMSIPTLMVFRGGKAEERIVGVDQRLGVIDVDGRHAGSSRAKRSDEGARLDEAGSAGVHEERRRLHARQVVRGDDPAGGIDETHVQREHVAALEERRRHQQNQQQAQIPGIAP